MGQGSRIALGQVMYDGGRWLPRPTALRRLVWEIHKRTAAIMEIEPSMVKIQTEDLGLHPFLYLAGDRPFEPWKPKTLDALGRFLRYGGTLLVDTAVTEDGDAEGFKEQMQRIFKSLSLGADLKPLAPNHVLYRAFYIVSKPVGRIEGSGMLSSITLDRREAVLFSDIDLGGAWARDNFGNWDHEVIPGGNPQREMAFRLGINIVLYTLCLDYKDEKPHLRFVRTRNLRP